MNPSVDDRLASIIRSLSDIILPALPREEGLAQEQMHLVIGHLKIIQTQLDAVPAFEAEELSDARAFGLALLEGGAGGPVTAAALIVLREALDQPTGGELPREARLRIVTAIDELIRQTAVDATEAYRARAVEILLRLQRERTLKDRKWFALMGFDSDVANGA
jgi:hypothetical protein